MGSPVGGVSLTFRSGRLLKLILYNVYTSIYIVNNMFLYEVIDAVESVKVKYAIVGGYALALHGIVRGTMDVDLVLSLSLKDFELVEKAFMKAHLKSRLPIRAQDVIKMRKEYIEQRNLITWSFVDYQNPSRQADILITEDVANLKIEKISVSGRKIPVASLQDLLAMKLKAARPQDLVDIENIRKKIDEKKKS